MCSNKQLLVKHRLNISLASRNKAQALILKNNIKIKLSACAMPFIS